MSGLTPKQQSVLRCNQPQTHKLGPKWAAATLSVLDSLLNWGSTGSEAPNGDALKGEITRSIDCQEVAAMQPKGTIPAEATLVAASRTKRVKAAVRTNATIKRTRVRVNRSSLS
ncbi:hypothetical protein [Levilactobacillus zymae]|uniref:hypothetical protein n=1 Tax=Levilactobacillus zymae TaxID=267363 RepID=UPI0028B7AFC9|nr:hypothetical protein [Levilactobacillus zymae]MDT6979826.1 hypothetical protein [Levilactobacillus zymae]